MVASQACDGWERRLLLNHNLYQQLCWERYLNPKLSSGLHLLWLHDCRPDTHAPGMCTKAVLLKGLEFLQSAIFFEGFSSLKLDLQSGLWRSLSSSSSFICPFSSLWSNDFAHSSSPLWRARGSKEKPSGTFYLCKLTNPAVLLPQQCWVA